VDFQAMRRHASIRKAIADVIPGYEEIGAIDDSRQEFEVGGRALREPHFPTATGRASFWVPSLPAAPGSDHLRLMTVRSEGQFNTVVYEEEDPYRGQERRDVILMNSDDIARLGLAVNQAVVVRSKTGELGPVLVRPFDIRPGNAAMYYPEANVLVSNAVDSQSGTPAFKSTLVTVRAAETPETTPTPTVLAHR
ncbi:MAG TPA: molybdopterin dinucleotide binding domain-containing protein, partial [Dehalococcoidia bacterium]|nr:molybdopterin dinucleotide binding domain-containing protein [Dehalococcoidia bacterium]